MYLEGGDLLRVTESELLRFGLCIGLDIDDRTVVELQYPISTIHIPRPITIGSHLSF